MTTSEWAIPHSRPDITGEDVSAVEQVIRSGMVGSGARVREFEQGIASMSGATGAVATASGTAALELALEALDLSRGAEIVIPTYVCRNVRDAVLHGGFTPIFCDVGEHWNITPETVAPHVGARTGAIIAVHTFGIAANVEALGCFGVPLVEDACQAFGLDVNGRMAGTTGDIGVCSFHATKCLCTGEGGAVIASRPRLLQRIRDLAEVGAAKMSDLQAALGLSQLERYPTMLDRRTELADTYFQVLSPLGSALPLGVRGISIFFRFPLVLRPFDFDALRAVFELEGVHVRRGVDELLHRQALRPDAEFPVATDLFNRTLSIPLHPSLTPDETSRLLESVLRLAGPSCV
jgi:perosamine synthetase